MRVFVVALTISVASGQFRCPRPDGNFEDARQCDKYHACYNGISEEKLCPDGLVFDPFSTIHKPCDHYFNVDCGDRLELQPPKGSNNQCPRLNGFYAHPDPYVCNVFYACVEGVAKEYTCDPGMWFDEFSGICTWPIETKRSNCGTEHENEGNGFSCPDSTPNISNPHPKYADPSDCAKFYICLNGVTPREQGCELGLVFNELTQSCDLPKNVPECKDYYAFLGEDESDDYVQENNLEDDFIQENNLENRPINRPIDRQTDESVVHHENGISCPELTPKELYNKLKQSCDLPKNVPECKKRYAFLYEDEADDHVQESVPTQMDSRYHTLPHEKYCDHYYELNSLEAFEEDQAILRSCPNGLVYTGDGRQGLIGVCDYPHRVDCKGRELYSK